MGCQCFRRLDGFVGESLLRSPITVPLLQTSKVWVPVCFHMDTGMGLGPWALALGGAWALALGAWPWDGFS